MKFYFLNTCYTCPEQYAVYRANGEECGYVRLRWGTLYASYPGVDGGIIYEATFKDRFKGEFEDDTERDHYLKEIAISFQNKILNGIPTNLTDNDVVYEVLTDPSQLEERLKNG